MKKTIIILIILLLVLQYKIWLGDDGIPEIVHLQEEIESTGKEVDKFQERNSALEAEVKDLKKGLGAIEERARSELGMIGKEEVYYQVVEPRPDQLPEPDLDNKTSENN